MDSYNQETTHQLGIYKVKDIKQVLLLIVILLPLMWITYLSTAGYLDHIHNFPNDFTLKKTDILNGYSFEAYIAITSLTSILLLRLRAIWSGVKLDMDTRTIYIPGGHISANNFIDFCKPSFLLQYFLRFDISMEQIRQIGGKAKVTKKVLHDGRVSTKSRYSLELRGTFGAANVWFIDEGKRDEIYAAIRELNEMGEPFLRV